ncbi:hypothetical protein KC333_g7487 [Hortaea werneckii]|nr:hypothetical protein KC333_g7487 [Hortaea werneckii]KAI7308366.1 hypothetical protein KC326_g7413 [Hortaea werneckii]
MSSITTSDHVSYEAESLPMLAQINREVRPDDEDQAFWWNCLSETLASLLQANQYSNDMQLHYLRWFYKWIPQALGPRPIDGEPYYGSWITHDLSPLEYSLNWKEKSSKQTVRFTIEAVTKQAGTAKDPINQLGAKEFLDAASKDIEGLDLTRFNQFLEATNIPNDSAEETAAKHPAHFPRSRVWLAFDLEHSGTLMVKSYFLPHWRAIQSGISANTFISDTVRACNGPDGSKYDGALDAIHSYLLSLQEHPPQIGLLSNDCVAETAESRLKIYFRSEADTLNKARSMYNLGGRLKGTNIDASLEGISDIWHHLFRLDRSDPGSADKVCLGEHKCIFVYEMRPTQDNTPNIDVKFHIPMWQLAKTDNELSELMASWFASRGHADFAARYKSDLNKAFPRSMTEKSLGTHTYLSITYTPKTGHYLTMYLSPKLPETFF